MIFTHSIISGYICLQGSLVIHIPMIVAMLIFVKIPNICELKAAFPGKDEINEEWYMPDITIENWYMANIAMHGVLAFCHIICLDKNLKTSRVRILYGFQLIAVLL